jgi:hypothetical protein
MSAGNLNMSNESALAARLLALATPSVSSSEAFKGMLRVLIFESTPLRAQRWLRLLATRRCAAVEHKGCQGLAGDLL